MTYEFSGFQLEGSVLQHNGRVVPLMPKAVETLAVLVARAPAVVTKDEIISAVWPDTVVVRFLGFAESSLNVELMAWFQTTDVGEYRDIRQDILLGMMELVENAGTTFAFPTRTVHLVGPGSGAAVPAE